MQRRDLLAAAAALTAGGAVRAQAAAFDAADLQLAERLRDAALADTTAWRLVQELCTQVGARPAGSAADAKAAAWAQASMKQLGLAQVLAPLGVAWPTEGANVGTPGPDAALLMRRHKWPALQLSQDGTHYFDVHHTVNDTLDRIDSAALQQNVACWAVTAWLAAQSPLPFGPPPGL